MQRSDQRRGPGVYYTLVGRGVKAPQVTPQTTSKVTPETKAELLRLLAGGKRLSWDETTHDLLPFPSHDMIPLHTKGSA
jgi:hypothetical protein